MLDHAREAIAMANGKSRADLDVDRKLNLALVRLLKIIGEAAGRMSPEECVKYPDIPWHEIVSLRNRLIHGYDPVDFDILWQIVKNHLPPLIGQMRSAPMPHDPTKLPIDGTLDLHTFRPEEVKDVVQDYLAECRERGILQVRIIHGKGIGTLREIVHATLKRVPEVESFRLGGEEAGGWGATIIRLKPI